jgi:hypothetical protein
LYLSKESKLSNDKDLSQENQRWLFHPGQLLKKVSIQESLACSLEVKERGGSNESKMINAFLELKITTKPQ